MTLAAEICYRLARHRVLRRQLGNAGANPQSFDRASYQRWRQKELEDQYRQHFSTASLQGKDVLDFGCGGGELSLFAAENKAQRVTGFDVDPVQHQIALENARLASAATADFMLGEDLETIPFADDSFDLILCFDVLEHILAYRPIIDEWRRVLRPGGRVFIWWVPYYHPYGHHVESLVPLPWVHAVLPDNAIIDACARIYDMPEFSPRIWDLDRSGRKKPNKWRNLDILPTLNKLTISGFEKAAKKAGFVMPRREFKPMSGPGAVTAVSAALTRMPIAREFFTACTIYELVAAKQAG